MNLDSPIFTMLWGMIFSAIPIGLASVKNAASARKFVALFSHGVDVLNEAIRELQAKADNPQ